MSRFLILLISVLVLFWLLRRALGSRKRDGDGARGQDERKRTEPADEAGAPDLVPCAVCGVLLPGNEALAEQVSPARDADAGDGSGTVPKGRRYYCSEDHRRQGSA